MKEKVFKDPIYGYIGIPLDISNNVIDTPQFQRLRMISQTSYAPLYSSAVHNRFVHSLGVYHLGSLAGDILKKEIIAIAKDCFTIEKLNDLTRVFKLACLLHDVGHAPFSHTGEEFFLDCETEISDKKYEELHKALKTKISSKEFSNDIPVDASKAAAPHEIMSAIVGITEFNANGKRIIGNSENTEFFARCITGYKYSKRTPKNSILNCYIQLLNSKVIDVDKLDYLIRDSYITGYNTVTIDYNRLLSSLTIFPIKKSTEIKDELYELAYYKGAISVIENVVYAHDLEKKWIQSHPVILYESYLIKHIIKWLSEKYNDGKKRMFSEKSLSVKGEKLKENISVKLLCDDDIIYLMKLNYDSFDSISEYFDRKKRRHPLWKSEAEYKAFLFSVMSKGGAIDNLEEALIATAEYLLKNTENWVMNNQLVLTLKNDIKDLKFSNLDEETKEIQKKNKEKIIKVVVCILKYAKRKGYSGDFVLIKSSQFCSSFLKPDFSKIKIVFPTPNYGNTIVNFYETISSISGINNERDDLFYLFYNRDENNKNKLDVKELFEDLIKEFI